MDGLANGLTILLLIITALITFKLVMGMARDELQSDVAARSRFISEVCRRIRAGYWEQAGDLEWFDRVENLRLELVSNNGGLRFRFSGRIMLDGHLIDRDQHALIAFALKSRGMLGVQAI